jgi:glycosyltransferase involved in cell wall biosynthesis
MGNKRILVIGLVWPEPSSSAAGTRIVQLTEVFLSEGYEVFFASAASKSDYSHDLTSMGIRECAIELNSSSFDALVQEINPAVVLFDRFMTEEQYGWRVEQVCPEALRILDTEDLHCLRQARKEALKNGVKPTAAVLYTDLAKREIASILRCDLSLIISEVEMDILQQQYRVDSTLIYYLPFLEESITSDVVKQWTGYESREGFTFIGNYLHEPNWHTLKRLKTEIWPALRKKLPTAGLHIYGSYASQKVMQLANKAERFYVHGRASDAREALSKHRVLLAPIAFGAGVKGKFIDAMQVGTPAVTTTVGAESMAGEFSWNGLIEDGIDNFVDGAIKLHEDKVLWLEAQRNGINIINERYNSLKIKTLFLQNIKILALNLIQHREQNFIGQILLHHTANSTRYMSLWIEEKKSRLIHDGFS